MATDIARYRSSFGPPGKVCDSSSFRGNWLCFQWPVNPTGATFDQGPQVLALYRKRPGAQDFCIPETLLAGAFPIQR
jgi:hypothetical protein